MSLDVTLEQRRQLLSDLKQKSLDGGGEARVAKQHAQGKYSARERVERLVDPGTFIEFDRFVVHRCHEFGMENSRYYGDGVITGIADINGQRVALFSQDFTCWGGALGEAHAKKICKIMDFALEKGI
jgi:propionyl-CoA carboxylase beta chain